MSGRTNLEIIDSQYLVYKTYQDQKLLWLTLPDIKLLKPTEGELIFGTIKKSAREPASKAPIKLWHKRLGHIGTERIVKLSEMTEGITIESDSSKRKQVCEACQLADAPKQISRRRIGEAYGVFGRVHFDLIQKQPAYNGHVWMTNIYLDGIKCHFVFTHVKKSECQMVVRRFLTLIRNWLNIKIRVSHYDNERSAGNEVEFIIENQGCIIEYAPPGLLEMNGPAERSGGMIVRTRRALKSDTKLPNELWPEAIYAAAYMLNRTPTKMNGQWIIPWKELIRYTAHNGVKDQIVNLLNLRLYG